MHYKKLTSGNTIIEFHNNWLGEETVVVNGQVVSKKSSILGIDHPFTIMENGASARYILTSKVNDRLEVFLDLRKNRQLIQENVPVLNGAASRKPSDTSYKLSGLNKLKEFKLEEALEDFELALDKTPDDPEIYFHLACVYSVLEQPLKGFESLREAIRFGLRNQDEILTHEMLAFLRIHPEFEIFINSGYTHIDASKL